MVVLNDFSTSVKKALGEIDPNYESLNGLVVCGTHNQDNEEEMIREIKKAREGRTPALMICAGMQLMVIEYARNVWGIENATSEEFGVGTYVVTKMDGFRVGLREVPWWGSIYKGNTLESHWHQYRVDPRFYKELDKSFNVCLNDKDDVVETLVLVEHPFFVGTQWHPEYQSSKERPHLLLKEFLRICNTNGHRA